MQGDIREGRKCTSVAAAFLLGLCLTVASGCSSTGDEADAGSDVGEETLAGSDTSSGGSESMEQTPGADEPFPTLGSAPERPATSTPEQRRELAEGLLSDHARSEYSDEAIAFQGEPAAPLQPPEELVTEAENSSPIMSDLNAIAPPFSGSPETSTTSASSPSASASPPLPSPMPPPTPTSPPSPPVQANAATAGTMSAAEEIASQAVAPPFSGSTTPPPQPYPPPAETASESASDRVDAVAAASAPVVGTGRAVEPGFLGPTGTPPASSAPPPSAPVGAVVPDETSVQAAPTPAPAALPAPMVAAVSDPFAPPPPATGAPVPLQARSGDDERTQQARLQESMPMGGPPVLQPTIPPAADPNEPLVTVVVSSDGVQSYEERPVFLPELSPEPTRYDRFPSPGGEEPVVPASAGGNSVKVATILFGDGSAAIGGREVAILRKVKTLHRERGGTIRVVGHASSRTRNMDPDRHRSVNYAMSVERAGAVAQELVNLGVPSQMVVVSAMADEQPVYQEIMPSGEAGNRRAEIYIDY